MTQNSKITKICLGILLLISTASVVLRSISIAQYYTPDNGYFSNKVLINIANIMTLSVVAIFIISAFCGKKKENLRFNFQSPASIVISGLLSISVAFLGIFLFFRASERGLFVKDAGKVPELISIFELIIAILAMLSVLYLVLCASDRERHSQKRAMLGLCATVFFAAYATYLYFDSTLPINAPNKLIDQMAYLFAAIFFLFETRISLGRELWRPYVASGLIAATLCIYASLPSLIVYLAKGFLVSNSVFDFALTLSVALYAVARIVQYGMLKKDEESSFIYALRSQADGIEEEISVKEEQERLEYIALINQIGKENAIAKAEEEARLAGEARLAEQAELIEESVLSEGTDLTEGTGLTEEADLTKEATETESEDGYISDSYFNVDAPSESEDSACDGQYEQKADFPSPIVENATEEDSGNTTSDTEENQD